MLIFTMSNNTHTHSEQINCFHGMYPKYGPIGAIVEE